MSKPKLLVSNNECPTEIVDTLSEKFEVQIIDKPINGTSKQDILDNISGKFGLLLSSTSIPIDKDVINAAGPSFRVISTTSMGYDNMDTNALKKYNVLLGNSTIFTKIRVAELTVGLLIATARNFLEANKLIKTGKTTAMSLGTGLTNSAVGIIGCGNIGIEVANMLSGFKLSELMYSSRRPKSEMSRLGGQFVQVDDLVRRSDFIVLTGVLNPDTKFTINKNRLELMKSNSVIINVGRGELIDQDALIDALQEKRIRGAGLDVMTPEPLPLNHPLMTMENVVLLPHIAGRNTVGAIQEKFQSAADNIFAVLNNQPMPCEVKL